MSGTEIGWRVLVYLAASVAFVVLRIWREQKQIRFADWPDGRRFGATITAVFGGTILWPMFSQDLGWGWWVAGITLMLGTLVFLSKMPLSWLLVRLGKWGLINA